MAQGQPIGPREPLQTLFEEQGRKDNLPQLPEPTFASEIDILVPVVPLNTRMCRSGIHVNVSAKLCVDCDTSCDECQALECFADVQ